MSQWVYVLGGKRLGSKCPERGGGMVYMSGGLYPRTIYIDDIS